MPVKHRIRNSSAPVKKQKGLIQGKAPHRLQNAHKVLRKWPYYRAALIWFASMTILLLAVLVFGYGVWEKEKKFIIYAVVLIVIWVFTKLVFFLASKATTCPLCRACHLANSQSSKHQKAYKIFPLSYSSTAVLTAVFRRCVRCMHCGVTFDLTKKYRQ